MGVGLPRPLAPAQASLSLGTGSYSLSHPGLYLLGVQYPNQTSGGPRAAIVSHIDYWSQFIAFVNASRSYRVRGTWTATAPTMAVISWNNLWTSTSALTVMNFGCFGRPGEFCSLSLVLTNTSGTVDVVLSSGNPLCTNPADAYGSCVNLGTTWQGFWIWNASTPEVGTGTAVISVVFVSFEPATVSVVEPFTLAAP